MKSPKDLDLFQKTVLLRCDFNVPISKDGKVGEEFRIKSALPTINYLREKKAKIILLTHLEVEDNPVSLSLILGPLEKILNLEVKFAKSWSIREIKKQTTKLKPGEIILLENLRLHPGEKACDENFAKELASLGEIFINEAFSCCHRKHTSIFLLPKLLPSAAGFRLLEEVEVLTRLLENPPRPMVAIIGGVKVESKAKTIMNFLDKADHVLLGSKIGENILAQKMVLVGRDFVEVKEIEKLDLTNPKLHLPVDGQISLIKESQGYLRTGGIGTLRKEEEIFDIGPETIKMFQEIIKDARTIFFSGPLGKFEDERFRTGTQRILEAIVRNHQAIKVAGGGDTIAALNYFKVFDKFDFVSTGGGAMLQFLAGEKLPGIEVLKENGN